MSLGEGTATSIRSALDGFHGTCGIGASSPREARDLRDAMVLRYLLRLTAQAVFADDIEEIVSLVRDRLAELDTAGGGSRG